MDPDEVRHGIEAIARDETSGATELTLRAADLLLRALAAGEAEFAAQGLVAAKPMMAPLLNLACLARGEQAEARVRAFRESLSTAPIVAARNAAAFLARTSDRPRQVLTLSASRVVEETILALADALAVARVVVAESRPRLEGEAMATRLRERVPGVALTHDAALPGLCTRSSLVLLGADAVLEDAFVNKAGSLALCLAAREAQAPCLVVTTSHKVLRPEARPFFRLPEPTPTNLAAGLPFLDIQFERVPLSLVEAVATEEGTRSWDPGAQ